jgi:hypothetical protein
VTSSTGCSPLITGVARLLFYAVGVRCLNLLLPVASRVNLPSPTDPMPGVRSPVVGIADLLCLTS